MRRGPLRRGKPPQARTALTRKTPLVDRSGGPKRTPFRPSKPTVTPAERSARKGLRDRSEGLCEIGWVCDGRAAATDYAHRQSRAQGGPFDVANAGDACRPCHQRCHARPEEARQRGWMVRRGHDFRSVPVLHARHGLVLLASDGGFQSVKEAM